jgi:glycolate oxidase FAD binding subunit
LRLEGPETSVAARLGVLRGFLPREPQQAILDEKDSRTLWRAIADARGFVGDSRPLWRITLTPTAGPAVLRELDLAEDDAFFDWGGGLLWATSAEPEALAGRLSAALSSHGGEATLVRAPAALRAAGASLPEQPSALLSLARRVKSSFDPKGLFNPGRIYAGI